MHVSPAPGRASSRGKRLGCNATDLVRPGAIKTRERWAGKTVVAIVSGGNLDLGRLPEILAAG